MNKLAYGICMGLFTVALAGGNGSMAGMDHSKMDMSADKSVGSVVCPVSKNKVNPAKAVDKAVYKGKTYYFCCAGCKPLFLKNPEKYVKGMK